MKKNKKKLPRYWLGTKAPRSMGYQTPNLVGYLNILTTPGIGIESEVSAMRNNQIPNIIGGITKNAMWPMQMALHITPTITSVTGATAINNLGGASNLFAKGAIPTVGGPLNEAGLPTTIGMKAADGSKLGGGVLNATGKALGALGAAYGALNVGMDFANAGSHRSAGSMAATLGTNTVTTPGGNQYTTRSGFNKDAELAYERLNSINKGIGLTTDAMGTGASIGGLVGGLPGMLIGGAGGALFGLGASLFGFGNNEDEVRYNARVVGDNVAMENRQNKTNAYDLDVKDAFYSRSTNGTVGAKDGKMPGFSTGKPNARVSHGELVGNFSDGYYRVPGLKDNEDSVKTHLGKEDFVISNKHGLSDYAWYTGDIPGALAMQSYLQNTGQMKKYKNGRLPKFDNGTQKLYRPGGNLGTTDYLLSTAPSIAGMLANWMRLNDVNNSTRTAPRRFTDMPLAKKQAYEIMGDTVDYRPYLDLSRIAYNQYKFDTNRQVGYGPGGRMINLSKAYLDKLANDRDSVLKIGEINRTQRNTGRQLLANIDQTIQQANDQNYWKTAAMQQQINAAYEKYRDTLSNNILNHFAAIGSGLLGLRSQDRAEDLKRAGMDIYDRQVTNDNIAQMNQIAQNAENARLQRELMDRQISDAQNSNRRPIYIGGYRPWQNLIPIQLTSPFA